MTIASVIHANGAPVSDRAPEFVKCICGVTVKLKDLGSRTRCPGPGGGKPCPLDVAFEGTAQLNRPTK